MIYGQWYATGSAVSLNATFSITTSHQYLLEIENGIKYQGLLAELNIGSRLGNTQRKITLKDASVFSTRENDFIDKLIKKYLQNNNLLYTLESKLLMVFIALFVTILFVFIFFKWGLPWGSNKIAHSLPHQTNEIISQHTLKFLDKHIFHKSKLSKKKQIYISNHFHTKLVPLNDKNKAINYKIHFRIWGEENSSIPNALALPSGDIILTDKFIELSKNQDEIDAVLLHEMGHVVHRHGLQMLIEGTFITVAVMIIVGDSNAFVDMGVGLGSLLLSSAYSRSYESQADDYAFSQMLKANIDPIAFYNIMNRMKHYMEKGTTKKLEKNDKSTNILDYISSHPNTKERVKIAKLYSQCFKKGLSICNIPQANK